MSIEGRAESPLGAFLQSPLYEFAAAGGRVKLIGNASRNRTIGKSAANDSLYFCATITQGGSTLWTLRVAADMTIVWQRKHVVPNVGFSGWDVWGYEAFSSNTLLVVQVVGIGGLFLFIQSAADGSTVSVNKFSASGVVPVTD